MFRYIFRDKLNYLLPESKTDMAIDYETEDRLDSLSRNYTQITVDGKQVKKLNFHLTGKDGEMLWIEFITTKGEKIQSFYMKGII